MIMVVGWFRSVVTKTDSCCLGVLHCRIIDFVCRRISFRRGNQPFDSASCLVFIFLLIGITSRNYAMGLYLVESFKGANIFTKLAFIFLFIAMGFGWVAYCTASWGRVYPLASSEYYEGYGVWRYADNQYWNSAPISATGSNAPLPGVSHTDGWLLQWFGAFQAFATFGFISLNVGFFLIVLFMFVAPCKCNSDLGFWNAINNIFGCICWLVAVILFGSQFDKTYDKYNFDDPTVHYSFGFAIITFLLQLVAGIVLLLTNKGGGAVQSK